MINLKNRGNVTSVEDQLSGVKSETIYMYMYTSNPLPTLFLFVRGDASLAAGSVVFLSTPHHHNIFLSLLKE